MKSGGLSPTTPKRRTKKKTPSMDAGQGAVPVANAPVEDDSDDESDTDGDDFDSDTSETDTETEDEDS